MMLPPRVIPGKPLVPGPIVIPPTPPGGTPPPQPTPPTGPPVVGTGDPIPTPPRERIRYGLVSVHGTGPDEVALVIALPDNRVMASVMTAANAYAKIAGFLPLIAPDHTAKEVGRKSALAAEPEVPTFEQEVLAHLAEISHGQNVILDYVAASPAPPASMPKTFWDILRFAADSEWPSVPGAPEKPSGVSYDPLKGWRSDVIKADVIGDLSVLPVLDKSEADNVNTLCLRAWLGIGFLGRTGGDWADHLWRRNVVREILAGNLPEIESLIPTGERDRVLWGILEGEVEIGADFGARVHDEIQGLFPVIADGSGKSKSFAEIVTARIERLAGRVGGVPSGLTF